MRSYDPFDWYWFVGGDESRVWSSAVGRYYKVSNADYHAWLAGGGGATRIASIDVYIGGVERHRNASP